MIEVQVRGGNLEKAMRVLKKKVQKAGIVKDIRNKRKYTDKKTKKFNGIPSKYIFKKIDKK